MTSSATAAHVSTRRAVLRQQSRHGDKPDSDLTSFYIRSFLWCSVLVSRLWNCTMCRFQSPGSTTESGLRAPPPNEDTLPTWGTKTNFTTGSTNTGSTLRERYEKGPANKRKLGDLHETETSLKTHTSNVRSKKTVTNTDPDPWERETQGPRGIPGESYQALEKKINPFYSTTSS